NEPEPWGDEEVVAGQQAKRIRKQTWTEAAQPGRNSDRDVEQRVGLPVACERVDREARDGSQGGDRTRDHVGDRWMANRPPGRQCLPLPLFPDTRRTLRRRGLGNKGCVSEAQEADSPCPSANHRGTTS